LLVVVAVDGELRPLEVAELVDILLHGVEPFVAVEVKNPEEILA
jgi:hypothetical protein